MLNYFIKSEIKAFTYSAKLFTNFSNYIAQNTKDKLCNHYCWNQKYGLINLKNI